MGEKAVFVLINTKEITMKNSLLALSLLMLMSVSFAQTKTKPAEKPPTQKEMEEMMKAMQEGMEEMSPEDKQMIDSMGIKIPDNQNFINQYNYAAENTTQQELNTILGVETIPVKDAARIAGLPKTVLTDSQFLVFLQKVNTSVSKKISPASKKIADDAYQAVKKRKTETIFLASAANGLWLHGEPEAAIELMSRVVMENTSDPDNLNNYASFLSMNGGEHFALPILQKLNKKYPGNSTILNNIGQAWFGLGDMEKAEKYLDSTVRIFVGHSQANYTKCIIEESKGNKTEAIDCIRKSIKTAYSEEKVKKLEKLGGNLNANDISWNLPKPADALGLDKMLTSRPDFYYSKSQRKDLYPLWLKYIEGCQGLIEKYSPKTNDNQTTASQNGVNFNYSSVAIPNSNFIMDKARQLLRIVHNDQEEFQRRMHDKSANLNDSIASASIRLVNEVIETNEKYEKEFEEELAANPPTGANEIEQSAKVEAMHDKFREIACQESKPRVDAFIEMYNRRIYDLNVEWVSRMKYFTNEMVYYLKYSSLTEEDYQKSKNFHQKVFLACIAGYAPFVTTPVDFQYGCNACEEIVSRSGECEEAPDDDDSPFRELPDFDVINCNSHIRIWTPVADAKWDCNIQKVKIELGFFNLDHKKNLLTGQTISATAEVGISKSLGSKDSGPFKVEAKAGGGAFIEWGPKGITDVGVKVGVGAEAGFVDEINPYGGIEPDGWDIVEKPFEPTILKIGAEAKIGWNSGPALEGTGILKGLSIDSK